MLNTAERHFARHHLTLQINESTDYADLTLVNTQFRRARSSQIRRLSIIFVLHSLYYVHFTSQKLLVHSAFVVALAFLLYRLLNLVQEETLKLVPNFGLEKSTTLVFGRLSHRLFVPISNIHKVVINEVIYFNRVIYVLQVLTSGDIYSDKPIVVLFDRLLPPLACLEIVFDQFQASLLPQR